MNRKITAFILITALLLIAACGKTETMSEAPSSDFSAPETVSDIISDTSEATSETMSETVSGETSDQPLPSVDDVILARAKTYLKRNWYKFLHRRLDLDAAAPYHVKRHLRLGRKSKAQQNG